MTRDNATIKLSKANKEALKARYGNIPYNTIIQKHLIEKEENEYQSLGEVAKSFYDDMEEKNLIPRKQMIRLSKVADAIMGKQPKEAMLNVLGELYHLNVKIAKIEAAAHKITSPTNSSKNASNDVLHKTTTTGN